MTEQHYAAKQLYVFCKSVFEAYGFEEQDAHASADSLVQAELEGAGSHGISRLAIYAKRIREGRIAAKPNFQAKQTGSVISIDGGNGLGQVVASRAMRVAIPAARENGMVGIFIRNSNHFGTAAYFCQIACRENMALIAMTNSPSGIPPWGGKKAFFGTNPIAFGFPTREKPPIIVDMSSSIVARGKIILAEKQGKSIPSGWAIDEEGEDTTIPAEALKGAVLPLGGPKGYALALAVEMMTAVLSQAAFGPHVNNLYKDGDPPANVGHCFILMDISKWMPMEEYYTLAEQFIREIKEVPLTKQSDEILYPGERRYQTCQENVKQGISLSEEVLRELVEIGNECGVSFPLN
jgi:LDH2 family malate/lactate/ureidoglycolate dehydrogenase